ncbi:hypothetical protein FRC05_008334 [Tulasnella sp. 425]|nr:hypothetical protein FRC05_008334 [Tulasnella sp. 425]
MDSEWAEQQEDFNSHPTHDATYILVGNTLISGLQGIWYKNDSGIPELGIPADNIILIMAFHSDKSSRRGGRLGSLDRNWEDTSHPSDPHDWSSGEAQANSGTGGLADNPSRDYTTTVRTGNYGASGRGGVGNHRFVPAPELGRGAHNRRKSVSDASEGYPREAAKAHPAEGTTFAKLKG